MEAGVALDGAAADVAADRDATMESAEVGSVIDEQDSTGGTS